MRLFAETIRLGDLVTLRAFHLLKPHNGPGWIFLYHWYKKPTGTKVRISNSSLAGSQFLHKPGLKPEPPSHTSTRISPAPRATAISQADTFGMKPERYHTWSYQEKPLSSSHMHQSRSWSSEQEGWAEFPSHNHTRTTGLHRTRLQRGMVLLHLPFCNLHLLTSYSRAYPSPVSHTSHSPPQGQVKTSWNKLDLKGSLQSESIMCYKHLSKMAVHRSFTSKNNYRHTCFHTHVAPL